MAQTRGKADRSGWYSFKQQRVKYANISVKKDGVRERPEPSYSGTHIDELRSRQAEPWNVENVKISGKGIEVFQYARPYDHSDTQKGPKVLVADEFAWSVLFKTRSMKDICVREVSEVANDKHKRPSTFIELCFNYEGLPESKDSTQLKTKQPEDATMDDAGDAEAKDAEVDEGECTDEGEEVKGAEVEGRKADDEKLQEVEMEEEAEENEAEEEEEEEEEEDPTPDQFDLAKIFAGPNEFKDLVVRIAFLRSPAKNKPFQWQWPAVFSFLRGLEEWIPRSKIPETQYLVGLPLNEWMLRFGDANSKRFLAQPQEDGTTKWMMQSQVHQQLSWRTSTVVPAFGTPLPKAPQLPSKSPAPPQRTPAPAPTSSESFKGPRKRTLEEIEAEEEEIDQEEERLRARRRQLREERRQAYRG